MTCQRCDSKRIVEVNAKCSDLCSIRQDTNESDGYVPEDLGIGGGDYIRFGFCLECGQLQGKFPMGGAKIEKEISHDEAVEFFDNHFTEGERIASIPPRYRTELLSYAEDLGPKFQKFLEYFFRYNSKNIMTEFPAADRFATMFTDNTPCLEESER
jgi:hypothetical protein